MVNSERRVVLDVDHTLRIPPLNDLMPGTRRLVGELGDAGVEIILWTLDQPYVLDKFVQTHGGLFGQGVILVAGDLDEVARRRKKDTDCPADIEQRGKWMKKHDLKDPSLFGAGVIVDNDPYYGKVKHDWFVWINPKDPKLHDRDEKPDEWAEEIFKLIMSAISNPPDVVCQRETAENVSE